MLNSEVFSERMYNASVHTHAHKTLRSKGTQLKRLVDFVGETDTCANWPPPLSSNESFEHTRRLRRQGAQLQRYA